MKLTPTFRISLGLVSLTVSLLLLSQLLGLAPDRTKGMLESRKILSESLAIQFSTAAMKGDLLLIKDTLSDLVKRDNNMLSAAIRTDEGDILAEAGEHMLHWTVNPDGHSTPTHVLVPILKGAEHFATMEVSFKSLWVNDFLTRFKNSYLSLIIFVTCTGFAGYFLLIKRTMRELDPSAVIPDRVQAAFDVLEEGVMILDEKEQIVMVNSSFSEVLGKSTSELMGTKGSELKWDGYKSAKQKKQLPWNQVIDKNKSIMGSRLILARSDQHIITFLVNAAPIRDGEGNRRGVLVTLDDITELEEKNQQLSQTVDQLQVSTEKVEIKNKELEFLAAHDPMTHLLNRRALNSQFNTIFDDAKQGDLELSCIMCDIDHFKMVNDRYGHATGDEVIKMVSALLKKNCRDADLVGRYGGEEFCIALPDIPIEKAAEISNRIRKAIKADTSTGVQITMSFGVSSLLTNAVDPSELINQADKALYIAKESGRNRVVRWGDEETDDFASLDTEDESLADELDEDLATSQEDQQKQIITRENDVKRLTFRLQEMEELAEERAKEIKHNTVYDAVTGLPGRALFYDRITQTISKGRNYDNTVAILAMSVDAVQRVNEVLGFKTGDRLIKEISIRLEEILRQSDTVAILPSSPGTTISRLNQEDFGILLTDLDKLEAITWIVRRILSAFEKSFHIDGHEIYAVANIGISIFPNDGKSAGKLVKNATAAKRHSQQNLGTNRYSFFSNNINTASRKHLRIESQLHRALKNDEFLLHYQPKINTKTGKINGVEALIRWDNPKVGLIPPFEFIPVAEYAGLIEEIGEWVLATACRQARTWIDMGITDCSMAVNFSPKQFRQKDLANTISKILNANKLDPSYLVVEVTESALMENMASSVKTLHAIRALGSQVALDDFGTGYSSFGYLKNFPLTHVKIDRSFLADIETNEKDATLVKSIISMAHGMELKVTAEGVENAAQVDLLKRFDCDEMQGFLFSKPVPEDTITTLLNEMT